MHAVSNVPLALEQTGELAPSDPHAAWICPASLVQGSQRLLPWPLQHQPLSRDWGAVSATVLHAMPAMKLAAWLPEIKYIATSAPDNLSIAGMVDPRNPIGHHQGEHP